MKEQIKKAKGINNPCAQRLLSVKDAAKYLGTSESAMRHWIKKGMFSYVRFGSRIMLDGNDLDAVIERNKFTCN